MKIYFISLSLLFFHLLDICGNYGAMSVNCLLASICTSVERPDRTESDKSSQMYFCKCGTSQNKSEQVTKVVIMRIHLIVCINRCANDMFKSLIFLFLCFLPQRVEREE